jgi:hypothetical protein
MPQDKEQIEPALALLVGEARMADPAAEDGPNPLRSFRIEVASDSMVQLDEQKEKETRVEFLTAVGTFIEQMTAVLVQTPPEAKGPVVGLLMEMLKFGATGFKVGKGVEGVIDETADKLKQLANQPPAPPQPDPKLEAAKIGAQTAQVKAQAEQQRGQLEAQTAPIKAQAEVAKAQADIVKSKASVIVASENVRQAKVQAAMPPKVQ